MNIIEKTSTIAYEKREKGEKAWYKIVDASQSQKECSFWEHSSYMVCLGIIS